MRESVARLTQRMRTKALGDWGERTAAAALEWAGFAGIFDLNSNRLNHPFGDLLAERDGKRFLVGVRTRNRLTANGVLNASYNVCKKGADLDGLSAIYGAEPAWVTLQVDVEFQRYSCYFGTIAEINADRIRYSVPMTEAATSRYECLARDRTDLQIAPAWTNRRSKEG